MRKNALRIRNFGFLFFGIFFFSVLNAQSHSPLSAEKSRESITISGVIKNQDGELLIGASILPYRSCGGYVTDIDGNFDVPLSGGVKALIFTYTGYQSLLKQIDFSEMKIESSYKVNDSLTSVTYFIGEIILKKKGDQTLFRLLKNQIQALTYSIKKKNPKNRNTEVTEVKSEVNKSEIETIESESTLVSAKSLIQNIYPNPFPNSFIVELKSEQNDTLEFRIFNELGKEVYFQKCDVLEGKNIIQFNLQNLGLQEGSYFLSVFKNEEIVQTEMIVKHQ